MTASAPQRTGLALFGAACMIAGLAGLAGLLVLSYGTSVFCETWAFRLGLPGSLLASFIAQGLVVIGAWSVWRATAAAKRRNGPAPSRREP